ncbi:MAG: CapA family protein [Ruminococcus sp.]|jgi:poly-gamma-glutamate capsule biosynthesis protein CapA/YwtB (metallophosphatase superfamily)
MKIFTNYDKNNQNITGDLSSPSTACSASWEGRCAYPVKIIIGADIVPTESNFESFRKGDVEHLIGEELQEKLDKADFIIFNLEVPLTDKEEPIIKNGPNLIAPTYTMPGIQGINSDFFTLANNHILDQGSEGMTSTIKLLDQAGIAHAGAGSNLAEARKPHIVEIADIRVGIYCCAEHEFSIATETTAGANPFDPLESLDHVLELKSQCDYVIVLYHGGKEHYRYPSPQLQKVCRKLVEKGTDLVVCQHSHCIGSKEEWKNGTIVYGQGNFLFDHSESEYWQTSLLIEVELEKVADKLQARYHFYPLQKNKETVRLAHGEMAIQIMTDFQERSAAITKTKYVQEQYQSFAEEMLMDYLATFFGSSARNPIFRVLNKFSRHRLLRWRMNRRYRNQEKLALRNCIECEAHRELLLRGLVGDER